MEGVSSEVSFARRGRRRIACVGGRCHAGRGSRLPCAQGARRQAPDSGLVVRERSPGRRRRSDCKRDHAQLLRSRTPGVSACERALRDRGFGNRCPRASPERGRSRVRADLSRSAEARSRHREEASQVTVHVALIVATLSLPWANSLKEKRSVLRPLLERIRRDYRCSVCEAGLANSQRGAEIAIALVGTSRRGIERTKAAIETTVSDWPNVETVEFCFEWL
ncbi:MAG: DUF503 domain-containing protein [Armatimonadetes bacterium]|nr:DUF503 domain-containing protein [Armatimonadota bacterium]